MIHEIRIENLNPDGFIEEKIAEISSTVGDGVAINALSGGVDSAAVTMLGHKAIGERLKTYFIENGLMRQDEPQKVVALFADLGVHVEVIDARDEFFLALKGLTDPEEKREAVTQTFYRDVFGRLVRESGAKFLLQGTILTDVDETVAGIKRQHNVFAQLGIDPQEAFGYKILEPLVQIRKDGVRKVAAALGLPASTYQRMPFPGPALATRVIGEVTPERLDLVRQATAITEEARVRPPARGALLGQHRRADRNADAGAARDPAQAGRPARGRGSGRRERDLQHHPQAPVDDGGDLGIGHYFATGSFTYATPSKSPIPMCVPAFGT
jgi:GMP synthase (glutamine-hydrolysing)